MSLYNMVFGKNEKSDLLLAVVGLKQIDIERFRDVYQADDGQTIFILTRTGGDNRAAYPNTIMRKRPEWQYSRDCEDDNTYCVDALHVPKKFVQDLQRLSEIDCYGVRAEFAQHLALTLQREPTAAEIRERKAEQETSRLARLKHVLANGHTYVPLENRAMESALKLAEENGGTLCNGWGILPLRVEMYKSELPYAPDRPIVRAEIRVVRPWTIDLDYWEYCSQYKKHFPKAMAAVDDVILNHQGCFPRENAFFI